MGWLPSVLPSTSSGVNELLGSSGVPQIPASMFVMPNLEQEDREVELARERAEELKRKQALFLHKNRRRRKVEKKVPTALEIEEVDAARKARIHEIA